jgi:hypothetical protein
MSAGYSVSTFRNVVMVTMYQLIRRNIPEYLNFQDSLISFVLYENKLMNLDEECREIILKSASMLSFNIRFLYLSIGVAYNIHWLATLSPVRPSL